MRIKAITSCPETRFKGTIFVTTGRNFCRTDVGQNRCAVVPRGNVGATLSSCIFEEVRLRHHGRLLAAAVPYRKGASHDCSSTTNDGGYAATEFVASYPGILCPTGFAVRTPLR